MAYSLTFELQHNYDAAEMGISVPIILSLGQSRIDLWAKLDTGSVNG